MLALFGEIAFETLISPDAFHSSTGYTYAEHQTVQSATRLQWLANELQKISLEFSFHIAFVNPKTQMDLLRAAAEDHQARALVFGNGVHRGYFVIDNLEETYQQLADDGSYIATSARVELREWIPGAEFDPFAPPRRTTPPPGIVPTLNPVSGTAQIFDPSQPISMTNVLPISAIVRLSAAGVGLGVMYSPVPYSQPGVSGVIGIRPTAVMQSSPDSMPLASIVRAAL
ncbi:MAG TPA: phage tail protein [Candidatus Binataceae bacterium]|nr:phage tail protein [Candidatus Binataceae bacterium]